MDFQRKNRDRIIGTRCEKVIYKKEDFSKHGNWYKEEKAETLTEPSARLALCTYEACYFRQNEKSGSPFRFFKLGVSSVACLQIVCDLTTVPLSTIKTKDYFQISVPFSSNRFALKNVDF